MYTNKSELVFENAHIIFRNFTGSPDDWHRQGSPRSFHVVLEEDVANDLLSAGWNVKKREDKKNPGEYYYTLQVFLRFDIYPPTIFQITCAGKKIMLGEEHMSLLDHEEFENVDITVRPYNWSTSEGKSGTKAYLKSMYVTIHEDALAEKYASYDAN